MTAELPPGPAWGLGTLTRYMRAPYALLDDCAARYGDPFSLRLPRTPPLVMVADPDLAKEVFTGDPEVLRAGEANGLLRAVLGTRSLLLLDGAEHLRERRLMLPPFHGERMRAYGDLMTAVTERSVATWPAGKAFPVAPAARGMALEIIARAVFGVEDEQRLGRLTRLLRRLLDGATRPFRIMGLLLMKPDGLTVRAWRRWSPEIRPVDRMLLDEIARRRADPRAAEREDILSMLLQARDEQGGALDDEGLRDELMTLLVAGHETTAVGLTWALVRLARLPDVASRARDDDDYLDAVIKETLRLHPILPFSAVRATAAPVELGGRSYPAGVYVAVSAYLTHRRADVYPNPLTFRPERFLEQPAGTYTWMPFGGGRRRCLGASFALFELRTILRYVLRAGTLTAPAAGLEGDARRGLTLAPAGEGRVVFEPASLPATGRPRQSAAA